MIGSVALALVLAMTTPAGGPYAEAPLAQYMTPGGAREIAMARSAGPAALTRNATILVLTRHGYQTAVRGSNGFTCLVERSWMSPFDSKEFWNPKIRGPICYNPAASRTILLYTLNRTKLVLAGLTAPQMLARINAMVAGHALPDPEPGSMSYMLSRLGYLADGAGPWRPHLMFHAPKADAERGGANWGAGAAGSPVLYDSGHTLMPEPETIFMVAVRKWSDGSPAPK